MEKVKIELINRAMANPEDFFENTLKYYRGKGYGQTLKTLSLIIKEHATDILDYDYEHEEEMLSGIYTFLEDYESRRTGYYTIRN